MQVKKGLLCRRSGKIYQELEIEVPADVSLKVECKTLGGVSIPNKLYRTSESQFVLCLPILRTAIKCTLQKSAELDDSYSFRIDPFFAKWTSRFNYFTKASALSELRKTDQIIFDSSPVISIEDCYCGLIRRVITGSILIDQTSEQPPAIRVLDAKGSRLETTACIQTRGCLFALENEGASLQEFSFSIDIPGKIDFYCIEATSQETGASDFSVLEPSRYEKLVENWFFYATDASTDKRYVDWFERTKATKADLFLQRKYVFPNNPLFSIVVPLYNTPKHLFFEMVECVLKQTYPHWELVLVNSTPQNEELRESIDAIANDDRIQVVTLDDNYGISENTNRGIKEATGDYICFFDHDDLLEPNILFEYASAICDNPSIDMLYCDEDKLFDDGHLGCPYFKPDFSIDLLRNNNFLCHMLTARKSLLDSVGPIPAGYDGAQDHYMTLRISEETDHVYHVPKVLYHWRATAGSTALVADNKPYATEAGIRAVQSHLDRIGIDAEVIQYKDRPFTYRPIYKLKGKPKVSILIPSRDSREYLKKCIESIFNKSTYQNIEVLIIENNSVDSATFDYYKTLEAEYENIQILTWTEESDFNFSKLINFGAHRAGGEYLLLLNNDIEVISENWIETMLGFCQRKDVGAVGLRLYYPDMTYQHAGLAVAGDGVVQCFRHLPEENLPTGYFAYNDITRNVSAVTGACLMVSKDDFNSVGGFDEDLAVSFNDVDFCLKLRKRGLLNVYTANASLFHHESISRGFDMHEEKKKKRLMRELELFRRKWLDIYINGDPYFNRNFRPFSPWSNFFALDE